VDDAPILAERLRLGVGFGTEDRSHLLEVLSALDRHLAHWRPEQVDIQISVKDRGGREQKVSLEAWLPSWPPLVATASGVDLGHALVDVRKDLIRQIEDHKARRDLHGPRRWRRRPDSGRAD
jgi:ribosome-associated translation inhibitor RaiA